MRRIRPGAVQATYYAVTGVWPLLSYHSFEAITGRKREPWLVKTVGLLLVVVSAALAADPDGRSAGSRRLGIGTAVALGAVDVWYAAVRRRISPIYLADGVVEAGLVGMWTLRHLNQVKVASGGRRPRRRRWPGR